MWDKAAETFRLTVTAALEEETASREQSVGGDDVGLDVVTQTQHTRHAQETSKSFLAPLKPQCAETPPTAEAPKWSTPAASVFVFSAVGWQRAELAA